MSGLTSAAQDVLAAHHHVITVRQLEHAGVGRSTRERMVRDGVLEYAHKCVLVTTTSARTLAQRCAVLCAAHPRGFVTGPTAGRLEGLRRMPRSAPLHFAIRHGVHLPIDGGVHFRQTTALAPSDRRARPDGITLASYARLAFDLADDLRPLDHLSVLHQLVDLGYVTADELVRTAHRLCHPARPGSKRFLENLQQLGGGAAAQSHPEVRLAVALRQRGVPVVAQARVEGLADGRSARLDLAVPDVRWGVELDVHPEHRTVDGHAHDARRARQLRLVGWQIETVAELDLEDIGRLADELAALYRQHVRVFGGPPLARQTLG